jgi:hypothetical protein
MKLSEKVIHRHLTVVALAVGMSLPMYVMANTPSEVEMSTKMVTHTTTTTMKHKHHHAHMAMHKAHNAAQNHEDAMSNAKALDAAALNHVDAAQSKSADTAQSEAGQDSMKRVIWKNGVIYHDVEPTAQATNNGFSAPASTSDTMQGGVTSTTTPVTQ